MPIMEPQFVPQHVPIEVGPEVRDVRQQEIRRLKAAQERRRRLREREAAVDKLVEGPCVCGRLALFHSAGRNRAIVNTDPRRSCPGYLERGT